jgi:hypothetical protein
MHILKSFAALLLLGIATHAAAGVDEIPDSATWYFHADFKAMRDGKASRGLYDWLNAEVFEEIRGETGIDFDDEAEHLTAFSSAGEGPVILLDGNISQDTKDKIMAIAAADGELQTYNASGKTYYFFDGDGGGADTGKIDIEIDSLKKEAYVSLALKNKIVVTNTQAQMKALLANNGKIESQKKDKDALLVLRAERSLIQAGAKANEMGEGDDWDSKILRNTRQIAVMLADLGDKLGVEALLMANEPEMAFSLASIVRGLIGLQALNDDMDSEIAAVLQSTQVDVSGNMLKLALSLDPATVVSALED